MTRWLWFAARECVREGGFAPLRSVVSFLRLPRLGRFDNVVERPLAFLIAYEEAAELASLLPPFSPLLAELNRRLTEYRARAENAAFATGTYAMLSGVED